MTNVKYTEQDLRDAEKRRVIAGPEATKKRDLIILGLLAQGGWTMERVATVLGVSRAHVNNIHKARLRELGQAERETNT